MAGQDRSGRGRASLPAERVGSESLQVPPLFVDFAHDAALRVLVLVHAAGPRLFAFVAEAINFVLAVVVPHRDGLLANRLLHVWTQSELRVIGHVRGLLHLVNLPRDNGVDYFIRARGHLDPRLCGQLRAHFRFGLFLLAHILRDCLG